MALRDFKRRALDPFEYQLAVMLGRTVAELRATMSNAEYQTWRGYAGWEKWWAEKEAGRAHR